MTPRRKPLVAAAALGALGLAVVLAMTLVGGGGTTDPAKAEPAGTAACSSCDARHQDLTRRLAARKTETAP